MNALHTIALGVLVPVAVLWPTATRACDPVSALRLTRAAQGRPAAWTRIQETRAFGTIAVSGFRGTVELDADVGTGRYAERLRIPVRGDDAQVFDGRTVWSQDISGGVHPLDAPFPRAQAMTDAYLTARAYLRTNAYVPAECLGTRKDGAHRDVLVRIEPAGGIPAVLRIDARTHLLSAIDERLPTTVQTTRYADYRTIDGVALPFAIVISAASQTANAERIAISHYDLRGFRRTDFARPVLRSPGTFLAGRHATTVPLNIEAGEILVWASIDGKSPLPFLLDTGGHAILTAEAAARLGLHPSGAGETSGSGAAAVSTRYAEVATVRVGDAAFRDQHFLVIPYGHSFSERGGKTPIAGILGLEVFERFTVRIDYARRQLTLSPLGSRAVQSNATRVPFTFQEDMPMVVARADGKRALFGTDTGNSGSLILFGKFLASSGLDERYAGGYGVVGHGTGGDDPARIGTLRTFTFGGTVLHDVRTAFTNMSSGSFSSWTEGGNVGYTILSRFVPVYDYGSETLSLEPSPHAPPLAIDRAGFGVVKDIPNAFVVTNVRPHFPAAVSGLLPGDRIVSIDGRSAADLSRADLVTLESGSSGTRMRLTIVRAGTRKQKPIAFSLR